MNDKELLNAVYNAGFVSGENNTFTCTVDNIKRLMYYIVNESNAASTKMFIVGRNNFTPEMFNKEVETELYTRYNLSNINWNSDFRSPE